MIFRPSVRKLFFHFFIQIFSLFRRLHVLTRKRLEGPELEGPEHFEKKYQNVPGAAGPAAGAAAASAVCIYYVIIGGALRAP